MPENFDSLCHTCSKCTTVIKYITLSGNVRLLVPSYTTGHRTRIYLDMYLYSTSKSFHKKLPLRFTHNKCC